MELTMLTRSNRSKITQRYPHLTLTGQNRKLAGPAAFAHLLDTAVNLPRRPKTGSSFTTPIDRRSFDRRAS
jgi:hypothetical protein